MAKPDDGKSDEQEEVKQRLAKAVSELRDLPELQAQNGVSTLFQVWVPDVDDGQVVLRTKGETFGVNGSADVLAELRCVACKIDYPLGDENPDLIGPPVLAFGSARPCFKTNLQTYGIDIPGSGESEKRSCVHSVLVLPIFDNDERKETVAALEIVQNATDMASEAILTAVSRVLEECGLFTSADLSASTEDMIEDDKNFEAVIIPGASEEDAHKSPVKLEVDGQSGKSGKQTSAQTNWEDTKSTTPRKTTGTWKSSRSAAKKQEPVSTGTGSGEDLDGSDGESDDKEMRDAPGNGSAEKPSGRAGKGSGSQGGSRVARRGTGTCGKPGKKLQLHELQAQFGLGLKEAAARLRVCPTTLKRACRRHGIQRWPRRQVLRDSGADSTVPTSTGLPSLGQAGNLASRLAPDLAIASYMASTGAMDQSILSRLSNWNAASGLGLLGGFNGLELGSRLPDVTGAGQGIRLAEALNLRHAVDAAGDARSGGAKPLPGPSYEQMDVAGFGGDGSRSPHSRGAGEDTGGSPSLNGLGLTAFANHGLLDQALRGLTPPSPVCPPLHQVLQFKSQRGDLETRLRMHQIQNALRKANSNGTALRQLAQANSFNRHLGVGLPDVLGGGANNSSNLHELLAEAEALLKQPRRATDPVLQQALEICNVHSGVNIPLKANEYEMRQMMQSFAASGGGGLDDQSNLLARLMGQSVASRGPEQTLMDPNILSLLANPEATNDYSNIDTSLVNDPQLLRVLAGLQ